MLISFFFFFFEKNTSQYDEHLTQLESNIRIAQKKAMEQAENDFLDVGEEGYEDDYMLDSMDMVDLPDRPGEDEWDPDVDTPVRAPKKSRKSSSINFAQPGPSNVVKPKGKRGRPAKNKGYYLAFSLSKQCQPYKFNLQCSNRSPGGKSNSPRVSFSSPRGSKRKATDVLDDLQFSASEKEDDEDDDDDDEELEEVAMDVDVDANYDPEAEFFSCGPSKDEDIRDDLQVSESEEEGEIRDDQPAVNNKGRSRHHSNRPSSSRDEDDDGGLWF